jgi:hypothetical protein
MQHPDVVSVATGVIGLVVLVGTTIYAVDEWDAAFARAFGLGLLALAVIGIASRVLDARWQARIDSAVLVLVIGAVVARHAYGLLAGFLLGGALAFLVANLRALTTRVRG